MSLGVRSTERAHILAHSFGTDPVPAAERAPTGLSYKVSVLSATSRDRPLWSQRGSEIFAPSFSHAPTPAYYLDASHESLVK
jgi:hypothetical protein